MSQNDTNSHVDQTVDGPKNGRHVGKKYEVENKYLLDAYQAQKDNRFESNALGPFIVHIFDKREGCNLGKYHLTELGLKLFRGGAEIVDLLPAGPVKYAAKFATPELANDFVTQKLTTINENWCAFIPDTSIYKIGLIYNIGEKITGQDILDGLDENTRKKILKVERVVSKIRSHKGIVDHPTDKFKIFAKNELPENIRLFGAVFRTVEYFIPAVLRCFNCQRYGHSAATCRNGFKCVNCGEDHYTEGFCSHSPRCANCRGNHSASDRSCVHFQFNKEINFLMTQRRISRAEAITLVQSNYKLKFEQSKGKKLSETYIDPSNPYISKREFFEHKDIFTVLANEWPEIDEVQITEDGQTYDISQIDIIGRTVQITTSNQDDETVNDTEDIAPETQNTSMEYSIISPSQSPKTNDLSSPPRTPTQTVAPAASVSPTQNTQQDKKLVNHLDDIRDNRVFESMTRSAQKQAFKAKVAQNRRDRKDEQPYAIPAGKRHKPEEETKPNETKLQYTNLNQANNIAKLSNNKLRPN
ncbi:hypothetical protein QAD02_013281 [Eretmocerus hayati]|uniref:Uncharacterized protein n=1 Tax=Eretmocerus hayati TaxID=131215 RepID=A0ACC2P4P7_9HYME|nr:hypothetical protein QAD02_013281 [Eretmocerus hayati]